MTYNGYLTRKRAREVRREEYIQAILRRTPYTPDAALYQRAERELDKLSDDVLMMLSICC